MTTNKAPQKIPEKIQKAIDDLTPDMTAIVQNVEKDSFSAGLTQFNYGGYMSSIQTLNPSGSPTMLFVIASALIAAGGDERGIRAAVAIITGRDPLQALEL